MNKIVINNKVSVFENELIGKTIFQNLVTTKGERYIAVKLSVPTRSKKEKSQNENKFLKITLAIFNEAHIAYFEEIQNLLNEQTGECEFEINCQFEAPILIPTHAEGIGKSGKAYENDSVMYFDSQVYHLQFLKVGKEEQKLKERLKQEFENNKTFKKNNQTQNNNNGIDDDFGSLVNNDF